MSGVEIARRPSGTRVCLVDLQGHGDDGIASRLRELGVVIGPDSDLDIVLVTSFHDARAWKHAIGCEKAGRPWLMAKLTSRDPWIGTVNVPGRWCCAHCLRDSIVRSGTRGSTTHIKNRDAPYEAIAMLLATALRHLCGRNVSDRSAIYAVGALGHRRRWHEIEPRPGCHCMNGWRKTKRANAGATRNFDLSAREQLTMKSSALVNSVTGIISDIKVVTEPSEAVQIAIGIPHGNASGSAWSSLSCGRGRTPSAAKAGALGEAIERAAIRSIPTSQCVRATVEELGDVAISPPAFMQFSRWQYANRQRSNRPELPTAWVPRRPPPGTAFWWVPVKQLGSSRERLVPRSCVYTHTRSTDVEYCIADSNGCAAGKTMKDAELRALLELVERDAVGIWWYNKLQRNSLDIVQLCGDFGAQISEEYKQQSRALWALDLTTDLGVPVAAAISILVDSESERISLGLGCGLTMPEALSKALSELHQVTVVFANRCHLRGFPSYLRPWFLGATTGEHQYLLPSDRSHRPRRAFATHKYGSADLTFETVVSRVQGLGIDILSLNHTIPSLELSVSRLMAPGLCHFYPRFGAKRLLGFGEKVAGAQMSEKYFNEVPFFL